MVINGLLRRLNLGAFRDIALLQIVINQAIAMVFIIHLEGNSFVLLSLETCYHLNSCAVLAQYVRWAHRTSTRATLGQGRQKL